MLAFVDVDTLEDFFGGGKLEVPGADSIIPNLDALTNKAVENNIPIFAFCDNHPIDASEFDVFPPHCITDTEGAQNIIETRVAHVVIGREKDDSFLEADVPKYFFHKNTYDAFSPVDGNPNIDTAIKKMGIDEVVIYGVVTEICVNAAVEGFLARKIKVHVVDDAVMHLNIEKAAACRESWYRDGVYFTTTQIVTL